MPCIVLAHLTPTQRRAYVLADNKVALNPGWGLEMLSLEIGELGEAGFDLRSSISAVNQASKPLRSQSRPGHRKTFFAVCIEMVLAPSTRP